MRITIRHVRENPKRKFTDTCITEILPLYGEEPPPFAGKSDDVCQLEFKHWYTDCPNPDVRGPEDIDFQVDTDNDSPVYQRYRFVAGKWKKIGRRSNYGARGW